MRPALLDSIGENKPDCAKIVANTCNSNDWDLSIIFIQRPTLFDYVPERVGCIMDMYDFTDEICWDEESCCLFVKIKDEYKKPYNFQLLKIKKFAKKIGRFFLLSRISKFYMSIEVYKGKYTKDSDCEMIYSDFVTSNDTINVKALVDFIYKLPVLLK